MAADCADDDGRTRDNWQCIRHRRDFAAASALRRTAGLADPADGARVVAQGCEPAQAYLRKSIAFCAISAGFSIGMKWPVSATVSTRPCLSFDAIRSASVRPSESLFSPN